jgi:hypothetical protein
MHPARPPPPLAAPNRLKLFPLRHQGRPLDPEHTPFIKLGSLVKFCTNAQNQFFTAILIRHSILKFRFSLKTGKAITITSHRPPCIMSTQTQDVQAFNFIDYVKGPLIRGDNTTLGKIYKTLLISLNEDAQVEGPGERVVIFSWNTSSLRAFLQKCDLLPSDAPARPPSLAAIPPAGVDMGSRVRFLMAGILACLAGRVGCEVVDGEGGVVGLLGDWELFPKIFFVLGRIEIYEQWFSAVLEAGEPLSEPLATIYTPVQGSTGGECNSILGNGSALWK